MRYIAILRKQNHTSRLPARSWAASRKIARLSEQQKKEMEAIIQETESIVRELMEKAKQEARSIIEKAQNEADEKLGAALQEKEKVLEEAKNSGYEQGLKSAQQDIEADRQLAMEQCENILAEARRNKLKIMESSVADMARLVMLIAKKIIATEIITNPEVIVNIIREAVGFLDKPDNIQIYLNPEDLEKITAQIVNQNLNDNSIHTEAVELIGDKNICPGGCVVESDVGSIDAQLETRLENIERAVWEAAVDEYNEHAEHE